MVGTTRFELATSPTPILETTQSEQLSKIYQYVREGKQPDGTLIGPVMDPQLDPCGRTRLTTRRKRQPARVHTQQPKRLRLR